MDRASSAIRGKNHGQVYPHTIISYGFMVALDGTLILKMRLIPFILSIQTVGQHPKHMPSIMIAIIMPVGQEQR